VLRSELSAVEMFCFVMGDFSNDNLADCTPNNNPENLVYLGNFPSTVVVDVQILTSSVYRIKCVRPEPFSVDFDSRNGRMATRNVFDQSIPLAVVVASVMIDYFLPQILGARIEISNRYSVVG